MTGSLCGAGAMTHWPALERWQHPGYLLRVAGRRTVPVELGRHYLAEGWGQSLATVEGFVRQHVLTEGLLLRGSCLQFHEPPQQSFTGPVYPPACHLHRCLAHGQPKVL